jgi:hypothetical protein
VTRFSVAAGLAAALVLASERPAAPQGFGWQGQASAWFILSDQEPSTPVLGVRYLPTLNAGKGLAGERIVDGELSVNGFASAQAPEWRTTEVASSAKLYRAWARYKTERFETRVGLQKINFGSAIVLRPLMWFDSVDPRDPLQITEGVYAALLRYYVPSNVSFWAWGLYGNERIKGWETSPTAENEPEFGGRAQLAVPRGELAFTTHHRRADVGALTPPSDRSGASVNEGRYAVDGKWDLGIGLWFEGVLTNQSESDPAARDQRMMTIGADYTFGVGNGLYVLTEYFTFDQDRDFLGGAGAARLVAASLRYPLGLLDTLSGILYVDTERRDTYRFVSWQRSYDRWQFHVMGFWNPTQLALTPGQVESRTGRSPLVGRGFQVMTVFNH